MDIDFLRDNDLIILECVSGSRAYGLDTPESDTDIKGVFMLPKEHFYTMNYIPQVSNETNDIVFYEFGRFMELLAVNNPNILELLNTPNDSIIYRNSVFDLIDSKLILSKLCEKTFGKFAISQIKKAKGLNKKIVNPVDKDKKSVLDFCFVNYQNGSVSLGTFLESKNWKQENCGLVNIPNMKDIYGLYHNADINYKGIVQSEKSDDISLSSIPKGEKQEVLLFYNKNGYSTYCKDYREYWSWVENRNEERYQNTASHGKNYDAKNLMHTFRLLEMAIEIGRDEAVNVLRPNRTFLLDVKQGKFEYNDLMSLANEKQKELENVFKVSNLSDYPDLGSLRNLNYIIREKFYNKK